jgi:hypothetical protein
MDRLSKIIEIIKRINDKVVFFAENEAYVVLKIDDYEKLLKNNQEHLKNKEVDQVVENNLSVDKINWSNYEKMLQKSQEIQGLTEQEIIDKINSDIAILKNEENEQLENYPDNQDFSFQNEKEADKIVNEVDIEEAPSTYQNLMDDLTDSNFSSVNNILKNKGWGIPVDRKKKADEIIEVNK